MIIVLQLDKYIFEIINCDIIDVWSFWGTRYLKLLLKSSRLDNTNTNWLVKRKDKYIYMHIEKGSIDYKTVNLNRQGNIHKWLLRSFYVIFLFLIYMNIMDQQLYKIISIKFFIHKFYKYQVVW